MWGSHLCLVSPAILVFTLLRFRATWLLLSLAPQEEASGGGSPLSTYSQPLSFQICQLPAAPEPVGINKRTNRSGKLSRACGDGSALSCNLGQDESAAGSQGLSQGQLKIQSKRGCFQVSHLGGPRRSPRWQGSVVGSRGKLGTETDTQCECGHHQQRQTRCAPSAEAHDTRRWQRTPSTTGGRVSVFRSWSFHIPSCCPGAHEPCCLPGRPPALAGPVPAPAQACRGSLAVGSLECSRKCPWNLGNFSSAQGQANHRPWPGRPQGLASTSSDWTPSSLPEMQKRQACEMRVAQATSAASLLHLMTLDMLHA
ncbi:uncharacterized protein LOC124086653 [Marmota monax]|uniref:uncharacterized protein LOC124086653 n=1 Tax=Marmota monax TaxID=9995 RepID=UPI0026F281DC|nr:uncharacterized protein LOC124086653 [Marmota monax]